MGNGRAALWDATRFCHEVSTPAYIASKLARRDVGRSRAQVYWNTVKRDTFQAARVGARVIETPAKVLDFVTGTGRPLPGRHASTGPGVLGAAAGILVGVVSLPIAAIEAAAGYGYLLASRPAEDLQYTELLNTAFASAAQAVDRDAQALLFVGRLLTATLKLAIVGAAALIGLTVGLVHGFFVAPPPDPMPQFPQTEAERVKLLGRALNTETLQWDALAEIPLANFIFLPEPNHRRGGGYVFDAAELGRWWAAARRVGGGYRQPYTNEPLPDDVVDVLLIHPVLAAALAEPPPGENRFGGLLVDIQAGWQPGLAAWGLPALQWGTGAPMLPFAFHQLFGP